MTAPPAGSNRLAVIASEIVLAHEDALAMAAKAMERAVAAGNLLLEAKESLPHGQWLPWLAEHMPFSKRTAQNYMRLAQLPEAKTQQLRICDLSPTGALNYLAAVAAVPLPKRGEWTLGILEREDIPYLALIYPSLHAPVDGELFHHVVVIDEGIISTRRPGRGEFFAYDTLRSWGFLTSLATWEVRAGADIHELEKLRCLNVDTADMEPWNRHWWTPAASRAGVH